MKPGIVCIALLMGVTLAGAQTIQDEVAAREKKRLAEVAVATDHVNKTYLKDYEALLQRANLTGDAQGANLVRAMIHRLNPEPEPSPSPAATASVSHKNPSNDPATILATSNWLDHDVDGNGRRHHFFPMEFSPDGTLTCKKTFGQGTWKISDNELVLEFPGGFEKFPLPLRMKNWPGTASDGSRRSLEGFVRDGNTPAPSVSPGGGPTASPGYFGKSVP